METIAKESPAKKSGTLRYDSRPTIYLSSEEVKSIEKLEAGEKYVMTAEVLCEEKASREPASGKAQRNVTLRLTKVDFKSKKGDNDLASILAEEDKREKNRTS